ncbi:aminoglycoside 6'-N-acetyltransferase [Inquilinus ginsengisoli]|jgi:aminoglycoside 6'-N-acetyltransferase|uniref:GNAT family N-acetyltransferase n=1 Tax=Inquilinus ginsengisoli TaxID=363840 RepID=UPI003D2199A9
MSDDHPLPAAGPAPVALKLADERIADAVDPSIGLDALRIEDLPIIARWLERPHVMRWWGDPEEELAQIAAHLVESNIAPFLACEGSRPIGYMHVYHANPDSYWTAHQLPRQTFGIDLFLGETDVIGRGMGTRLIRLVLRRLLALPETARIQVDPAPANAAAIRAYEKAGFQRRGPIDTPDGAALYMTIDREG